jgi:2-polyprenyl-3-methyl-5-hydroxy-6-metoxy-1,4-benzoquinol methylase
MDTLMEVYKEKWDESYAREENYIFFPKEQCVKFLSRFVGKRVGKNEVSYRSDDLKLAQALDFGCGIGTQTKLLADFGLVPQGIDISTVAIRKAKASYPELEYAFSVISGDGKLKFDDNQFKVAIAESVIDSMHFNIAKSSLLELDRVTQGVVMLSLIGAKLKKNIPTEEVVETLHEQGTIQSYYDDKKIDDLLEGTHFNIIQKYTVTDFNELSQSETDVRMYLILSNI